MVCRPGPIAFVVLTSFLLSGSTTPISCTSTPPPSHTGAEVGAIAGLAGVVIATVVLVEVHNSHHTVKGCVTAGPNGLEVRNESNMQTYALVGVTANTTVGDRVKLHGSKEKRAKDGAGDATFVVEKMNRDYGPCKLASTPPVSAANPPGTS
jgi:hypothetical protein